MRLKVELFSTFQRKVRRRTAHQCHTRPRQVAHAAPLPRRRAEQPGDPANVLPTALCQGVFEGSAVLKTRLVCFSPYSSPHTHTHTHTHTHKVSCKPSGQLRISFHTNKMAESGMTWWREEGRGEEEGRGVEEKRRERRRGEERRGEERREEKRREEKRREERR